MAFLHSHSCECAKSELDIFTLPGTQTSIENSQWVCYNPVSSLGNDSPIEFVVPGQGEYYLDLAHTMLNIQLVIVPNEKDATNVGPVNNLLHSMFSQVDIFLNQKLVSPANNSYPYRAYLENLLNFGRDAQNTFLNNSLWNTDTAGCMEDDHDSKKNTGLVERCKWTAGGKTIDLISNLHCDLFNQDRFLINGVEMRIRLVRTKDAFCLMDFTAGQKAYTHLKEATLLVRKVKLSPGILLAHANGLSRATAKYPLTRAEVKSFTLHSGVTSETLDNVILGQLPKRVIIGFVNNKAYNGHRKMNPFNFQNFSINYLSLFVDGLQIPSKPLQPNFGDAKNKGAYAAAYQTLFTGTGVHFGNETHTISRGNYPFGYCLFAFDLTPDLSAHYPSHWNLVKNGSIRIEVHFENALESTINCVLFSEYDNVLEIDSNRQVVTDFTS